MYAVNYWMNVTLLQYPSKTDIVPGNTPVKNITQSSNGSHYLCDDINGIV